jgi:hypothetical protein
VDTEFEYHYVMPVGAEQRRFKTAHDLAEQLDLSPQWIYNLTARGTLERPALVMADVHGYTDEQFERIVRTFKPLPVGRPRKNGKQ